MADRRSSCGAGETRSSPSSTLTPRTRREYPQTTVASQLIGFSGIDGEGLAGIELALDKALRGTDGKRLLGSLWDRWTDGGREPVEPAVPAAP